MNIYDDLDLDLEQQRRLKDLIELPPTADIERRVEQERAVFATLPEWDIEKRRSTLSHVNYQQQRLDLAIERDAIQAGRPDGCWCLGVGGKHPDSDRVGNQKWRFFSKHCSCPEGKARKLADQDKEKAARQARYLEHEDRFRRALPFRFRDFTLESWKATTPEQQAVQEQLRAWFEDDWYEDAEGNRVDMPWSLVLHGPFGTGKTGLAGAIGARMLAEGYFESGLVHMAAVPRLLDRVRATFNRRNRGDESEADVMEELFDAECLILDDVGAERQTDWATEKLFTLINHRHDEQLTTIITSNLDPVGLTEHLGERTMWRVLEMSYVVSLEGCPNLRLPKPKQPKSAEPAPEPRRLDKVVSIKGRAVS